MWVNSIRKNLTRHSVDNLEGMAFGPRLPNGNRTLVIIADNNFNRIMPQMNQIILLEVIEERNFYSKIRDCYLGGKLYFQLRISSMILSAVLPSHFSGTPPFFQSPANSRSKNGGIASGSVPTSSLVPMVIVSGLSVLSRSVMQGIPITVVSSVIPPESVRTANEFLTR